MLKIFAGCLVFTLCGFFQPVAALPAADSKAMTNTTWKIKQTGPSHGAVVIYVRKNAFRIERGDLIFVSHTPDWKVYSMRGSKKLMMKSDFEKAAKIARMSEATTISETESAPWKKAGKSTIKGLSAICWAAEPKSGGKGDRWEVSNLRYWVTDDNAVSAKAGEFLAASYGLPYKGGIPLQMTYLGKSSAFFPMAMRSSTADEKVHPRSWLETVESTKVSVPDSLFGVPKGYKEDKEFGNLYLGNKVGKDNEILKDLMNNPKALFQSQ